MISTLILYGANIHLFLVIKNFLGNQHWHISHPQPTNNEQLTTK